MNKNRFVQALRNNSVAEMRGVPKSDLHSHAGRGGSISYIEKWANTKISAPTSHFLSLYEMNQWLNNNVKYHCPPGVDGYLLRIEAAFVQASADNVRVLALSYDMGEIEELGGMEKFIMIMSGMQKKYAPETDCFPDLALGYSSDRLEKLDEIFSYKWFNAIDIMNYAGTYSLIELKEICKKAKDNGLVIKAHIGEFGSADDVIRYAEELGLDEIQHGVAAAKSPQVMQWLAKHKVKLNVCPTSNVMLKVCDSYAAHPIRLLYDYGVPVTINTDDLLIFNSTLSEEYLHLFNSGLMNEDELYDICQTGLTHNYINRTL